MILVGNKSDLEDERQIPMEQGEELACENGLMYIETSAKTGNNVEAAFSYLINAVYAQHTEADFSQEAYVNQQR